ncbi:Flp pilus assembly protein CpaB [Aureimonas jatrophae]|jgi:pilus assembly protein CpaB|uniref:Pilus assembly protein CpaB n=1 Tax=Aureimonas jatrophae TaxID=1166073 RepID=A0A1H0LTW3_9HYPH|nr:Flp pilus assembly protein CpaB [Aureimonas jatrophae]MBB3952745.1 pilus assembly protein CpaB [Aureimonas jatrophae]SDO71607.1 pilus assembly protein CpaB [Aureimonas jatrophae]
MSVVRVAIFGVAAVAAVGAGLVALKLSARTEEPVIINAQPVEPPIKLVDVLVASRDIPMGGRVDDALDWMKWPEDGVSATLLRRDRRPDALAELKGSIARQSFFSGEPIREAKLIKSDRGFLSAILPEGKRAIAVSISTETAAGGFILPNDHVDVIMTRSREATPSQPAGIDTETVLKNLRVLAIDQNVEEKDGERVVVGSTATLEVDPKQAEALTAAARMTDRLILSLRSLSDSVPGSPGYAAFLLEQAKNPEATRIRLVRYGKTSDVTTGN